PPVPAPEMRQDVAHRVVQDVPHVQRSRGVRQHLELIPVTGRLLTGRRVGRVERALVLPDALPFFFDLLWLVSVHGYKKASHARGREESARPGRVVSWSIRAAAPRVQS